MHDIPARIADGLQEVEAVLRTSDIRDALRSPKGSLHSTEPFSMDTLGFERWLPWIFVL